MDAALERAHVEPGLREHSRGGLCMHLLAVVRGTGDGQFVVGQAEPVGGATGYQRQGLQYLHGRARKDRPLDVAERGP